MNREELKYAMEEYADNHGVFAIREMIAEICYEKAEHVRAFYPDSTSLAHSWDILGDAYTRFASTLSETPKKLESEGL